jgi:hypothetical protein
VSDTEELIDPDPFSIGLGLIQIISAGAAFLEARKQRLIVEQGQAERFRSAWFQSKRSLIFFKRTADEFETYMLEGGYARKAFRIGSVRLYVDRQQHQALRRLHGQSMTTASHLADDLDDLSDFLDTRDQAAIDALQTRLTRIESFPESYRDVISLSREVIQLYQDLIDDVGEREGFTADA